MTKFRQSARKAAAGAVAAVAAFASVEAFAGFTVTLYNGTMYGPGNLGTHDIKGGYLNNFIVTSALTGSIEFFNNGAEPPNVAAEKLHTGPVDGMLSDGTKLNENIDAAFVIRVNEPETQKPIELFISSVSAEVIEPDERGNLLFKLHAAFDTGFAEDVIQIPVQFSTGTVEVPISDKTREGLKSGHDQAGPYPAGTIMVGRLGDIDSDGWLDGMFVLAGNTPRDLVVVEGDPVLITRPFRSDIPVTPQEAFFYEINGIVQNFPPVFDTLLGGARYAELDTNLADIESRLSGARKNLQQASAEARRQQDHVWVDSASPGIERAGKSLMAARKTLKRAERSKKATLQVSEKLKDMLKTLEVVHKDLIEVRGRFL